MAPTPIQLDPNHSANSFADSTPQQAQANTRYGVQDNVDKWNAAKIAEYETQWSEYVAARDQRPDANNLTVPVPARAEAVYTDSRGWPYVDASDKPVIAPHTYVPATKTVATPGMLPAGQVAGSGQAAEPFLGAELFRPLPLPSGRVFQRIA